MVRHDDRLCKIERAMSFLSPLTVEESDVVTEWSEERIEER